MNFDDDYKESLLKSESSPEKDSMSCEMYTNVEIITNELIDYLIREAQFDMGLMANLVKKDFILSSEMTEESQRSLLTEGGHVN